MFVKEKQNLFLKDKVATIIFTSEDLKDFVATVLSATIKVPVSEIRDSLVILPNRVNTNINTQYSEVDALYKTNNSYINVEFNNYNYKTLDSKNNKYVCHLLLKQLKINKRNVEILPIYQININDYDKYGYGKFIYRSCMMEEELHVRRDNYLKIIDINLEYLREIEYTEIIKMSDESLEKLLYFFVNSDIEMLKKIYDGVDIMEKVVEKLIDLTEDLEDSLYYNREELRNETLYGMGSDETRLDIAKNLLKLKNLLIEKNFKEPKFLAVITGGKFAYTTEDNVKVIPIGCLR